MTATPTYTDLAPLPQNELTMIGHNLGKMNSMVCRLGEADRTRGQATIKDGRCLWTRDGRRIAITLVHGGLIASVSKKADPEAPAAGTFAD